MTIEELKQKATASELTLIEAVEKTQEEAIQKQVADKVRDLTEQIRKCIPRNAGDSLDIRVFVEDLKSVLNPESK